MARDLKIFMRGKGVSLLQQLLQRHGYTIIDKPGLFGVSTRDAVKDFQSRQGDKADGIVNDQLLDKLRKSSGVPLDEKVKQAQPAPAPVDQAQLDAITRLLIKKGIITEDELSEAVAKPQVRQITQPPLT